MCTSRIIISSRTDLAVFVGSLVWENALNDVAKPLETSPFEYLSFIASEGFRFKVLAFSRHFFFHFAAHVEQASWIKNSSITVPNRNVFSIRRLTLLDTGDVSSQEETKPKGAARSIQKFCLSLKPPPSKGIITTRWLMQPKFTDLQLFRNLKSCVIF